MSLVGILVAVLVVALIFWILSTIPMDAKLKNILYVVIAVLLILWLLTHLGGLNLRV